MSLVSDSVKKGFESISTLCVFCLRSNFGDEMRVLFLCVCCSASDLGEEMFGVCLYSVYVVVGKEDVLCGSCLWNNSVTMNNILTLSILIEAKLLLCCR